MNLRLLFAAVAALALASCAPARPPAPKAPPQLWTVSPNGEPLPFRAGQDDCRGALAAWFARADANGDGVLDGGEMQTDAARWFGAADLDHDGQVTADELAAVRRQLLPAPEPEPEQPRLGPRGREATLRSQARPDPVMQADSNADFRVSAQEFRSYVSAQFAQRERHGALSQAQVLDACQRPAGEVAALTAGGFPPKYEGKAPLLPHGGAAPKPGRRLPGPPSQFSLS
ncbi:MAG: hypothetical protein NVV74_10995 [Magnetospirillum sp.]|nr:hypothetical protein [Magnetospirillum sp.]